MRRAAGIILIRKDGKLLLQKRDENTLRYPGFWGIFGGEVEETESPEECMRREAKEELDIDVQQAHLVFEQSFRNEYGWDEMRWIFVAPFEEQPTIKLQEGEGYGWFFSHKLPREKISRFDFEAIIAISNFQN